MSNLPKIVVDAAESQIGSPYVFGAWGEFCTPSNRGKRERADYPTIKDKCQVLSGKKSDCDGCQWQGDRMFDCRGFTYWCLEQADIKLYGQGATSQFNNADNWLEKGSIENMPDCVCCVFIASGNKKSHTGLYIGGNTTIECSVGVQKKPLDSRWTHYAIPKDLYTLDEIRTIRSLKPNHRMMLRKGSKGEAVKEVQQELNDLGYDCGKVDGIYGSRTASAVTMFQSDYGLDADGVVGSKTWAKLQELQEYEALYEVTIKHLTKKQVNDLLEKYPMAVIAEEV